MDRSDVTLERMRSFVRVTQRGSVSAVAREFSISQSTVSRHLQELESAIGSSLLNRTTRRITLTDEGLRYYADCVQILRLVEQAADDAHRSRGATAGSVRISCTAALGVLHVSRLIFAFQDLYPDITVDLSLSDERIDLVREGVDVALRLGPLTDSTMRLRTLGHCRRLLVAAPTYLEAVGTPSTPQELGGHQGIRMSNVAGSDLLALTGPDGERHSVPFAGRLRVDHGLAAREALLAGRGVAPAHHWLVDDLLRDGRLTQILPGYSLPTVPLSLLIVPERADVAGVRRLVAFFAERTGDIPGVEKTASGSSEP